MQEKRCKHCNKSESETTTKFHGLVCGQCRNQKQKEIWINNPALLEKKRAKDKEYRDREDVKDRNKARQPAKIAKDNERKKQRRKEDPSYRKKINAQVREWTDINREAVNQRRRDTRKSNPQRFRAQEKASRIRNRERIIMRKRAYYQLHKAQIHIKQGRWVACRRRSDPAFRLRLVISTTICQALRDQGATKKRLSCLKYLPYTMSQLVSYIVSLWEPWMNWSNYGRFNAKTWDDNNHLTWTWQLDHKNPQSDLPYDSMEHPNFQRAWALTNLRPYSAKSNCVEGSTRIRHTSKERGK